MASQRATITDELRERINHDYYPAGSRLPRIAALADEFGTSRSTVMLALRALDREGLTASRQGAPRLVVGDGSIPTTLVEKVCAGVTTALGSGRYAPGWPVPTLDDLMREYKVSRTTVIAAMDVLEHQGVVVKRLGRRTVFAQPPEGPSPSDGPFSYTPLRVLLESGAAGYQADLLARETQAGMLRVFTVSLVPGILQTPEYARARLTEYDDLVGRIGDIEATVALRMARGKRVREGDGLVHVVMCENVLNAAMAPPLVMREQLLAVAGAFDLSNVQIGIVPTCALHYAPMCEFWITGEAQVEVETFSALMSTSDPGEVALYMKIFSYYWSVSVRGEAAREMVKAAADRWGARAVQEVRDAAAQREQVGLAPLAGAAAFDGG